MSIEMDQFKDLYVQTAREHLGQMNELLLQLETQPEDKGIMEEIMRAGHSLKGESAAMGFEQMASLGHVIEDLFTEIGNGTKQLSEETSNALFAAFDHLGASIDAVAEPDGTELDCTEQVAKIKQLAGMSDAQVAPAPISVPAEVAPVALPEPLVEVAPAPAPMQVQHDGKLASNTVVLSPTGEYVPFSQLTAAQQEQVTQAQQAPAVPAAPETVAQPVPTAEQLAQPAQSTYQPAGAKVADGPITPPNSLDEVPIPVPQVGGAVAQSTEPSHDTQPTTTSATAVKRHAEQISSVSIKVEKLDQMIAVSEELVLLKMKLKTNRAVLDNAELKAEIHRLDRLVTDLQFYVMQTRLLPISMALHTLPRIVRDVAKKTGKNVRFEVVGEETTVDRTIIDHLTEPFVHLIRNAVDHGIESSEARQKAGKPEQAVVTLTAYTRENKFFVDIADDGGGIEWDRLMEAIIKKGLASREQLQALIGQGKQEELLFFDGASTSEQITDISGRGVGMSAVRSAIKKLGGTISVSTEVGKGTTFTIRLPMTLAIMQALLVRVGDQTFAMPANEIVRTITVHPEDMKSSANADVIVVDEKEVFLYDLAAAFEVATTREEGGNRLVVLVRQNGNLVGCVVDQILAEEEILVKQLGSLLKNSAHFSGATILADGRAAPIVNVEGLIN